MAHHMARRRGLSSWSSRRRPEVFMQTIHSPASPATAPDLDRYRRSGEELDRVRADAESRIGEEDVRRVKRLNRFSRAMEIAGRLLIHFSIDPFTWGVGVVALWVHKQLQATE